MKLTRFFILTLSFLTLSANFSFAQNKTQMPKKPFHFKPYALQFTVPDFLKFSNFEGSLISLKHHFNDHSAIRIGLSTNFGTTKDNSQQNNRPDSLFNNDNRKSHAYFFSVSIPYLYYFHPQKTIKFYSGIGPRLSYGYSYVESDQRSETGANTQQKTYSSKGSDYKIGLHALAGVEWFFHQDMSLSLEYGALLEYRYDKTTKKSVSIRQTSEILNQTSTRKNWSIYPKSIYLVLNIYL